MRTDIIIRNRKGLSVACTVMTEVLFIIFSGHNAQAAPRMQRATTKVKGWKDFEIFPAI